MSKEIIKIDERAGYPMYCQASAVDKNNEVTIEFVVDGDKTAIVPGQHEIACSFLRLLKIDVLEVLEERFAANKSGGGNLVDVRLFIRCCYKLTVTNVTMKN